MIVDSRSICIAGALSLLWGMVAQAQERRSGVIVDTAGVATDTKGIDFISGECWQHFGFHGVAFPRTSGLEIAVPIESVVSIDLQGKSHRVRYIWRGQEKELSGTPKEARLEGTTDFGSLKLPIEKLRQITFKEPARSEPTVETRNSRNFREGGDNRVDATVTLSNGRAIPVQDPMRWSTYYSTQGYLIGGSQRYNHFEDLRFLRGESLTQVPFDRIATIEFAGGGVTVRLRTGVTATGKLSEEKAASVDGFTWTGDDGYYFVDAKQVKSIQFVLR